MEAITPSPKGEFTVPARLNGLPVVIGLRAFEGYRDLTAIVIPNEVIIGEGSIFATSCYDLVRVVVDAEHPNYVSVDGVLFDKKMKTLIRCPEGKGGAYEIPEGVVSIQDGAFSSCSKLTSVTMSSSLVKLGDRTFESNTGVFGLSSILVHPDNTAYSSADGVLFDKEKTTLIVCPSKKFGVIYVIPDGVRVIGKNAFADSDLQSIAIPESVTTIGVAAFSGCKKLTSLTIPKNVTSVGAYAFYGCNKLATVKLECAKPQKEEDEVFDLTPRFSVPRGGSVSIAPATKLIASKDTGWKNGEKFWGKTVEAQ